MREGVELEFLQDFDALTYEGTCRWLRPDFSKRIDEELELDWPIVWKLSCLPKAVAKGFAEEAPHLSLTEHVGMTTKSNLLGSNQKGDNL